MIRSVRWVFFCGFVVMVIAGCGSSTGYVSGKITFEGADLPGGQITFVPEKGNMRTGEIVNGTYAVSEVPVGEAKVTIVVPMAVSTGGGPPGKGGPAGGGPPPGKGAPPKDAPVPAGFDPYKASALPKVKIPPQYSEVASTPLKYTVTSGKQTKDFELK